MIFIVGCSTLATPVVDQPSSVSVGPATGTQTPITKDAGKNNMGEFENGGTAAADQGPENTQTTGKNRKPAENDTNSAAGQDCVNNRVDKDDKYFISLPLLLYDGLAPVYKPQYVTANESTLVSVR